MADYTPVHSAGPRPPLALRLSADNEPGEDQYAWDRRGRMWIDTKVRRRSYICSQGVEHRRYWRIWHRYGDDFACEHEVELHQR